MAMEVIRAGVRGEGGVAMEERRGDKKKWGCKTQTQKTQTLIATPKIESNYRQGRRAGEGGRMRGEAVTSVKVLEE